MAHNNPMMSAMSNKDVEEMKRLIAPGAEYGWVLEHAVREHYYDLIPLLLPVSHIHHRNRALRFAVLFQNDLMIDVLYDACDPYMALQDMQKWDKPSDWGVLEARIQQKEAQQLNELLHKELESPAQCAPPRKM